MKYTILKMNKQILLSTVLCTVLVFAFVGCSSNADVQSLPSRQYELVWSDDFDGVSNTYPNAANWNFEVRPAGWVNNEYQSYQKSLSNISLDGNGHLKITAVRSTGSDGNYQYTSGRIQTKGKVESKFGRIEARLKMPYGPGLWPAFWMLGDNDSITGKNTWPECGEIDIMEMRGNEPTVIHGSVHGPGYSGGMAITDSYQLTNNRFDADYHILAVEWGIDYIDFYMDNVLYNKVTPSKVTGNWVFNDNKFYIILNVAVGGFFVSDPTPANTFPQTMYVDYVKVYKEVNN